MQIIKVESKSKPGIFRQVMLKTGLDGSLIYECTCPASVWFRLSNGQHGANPCRHISMVKNKDLTKKRK